jgi:hypothetical protein
LKKDLQVATVVITKTAVFLDVTFCCLKDEYRRFKGACFLVLDGSSRLVLKHRSMVRGVTSLMTILSAINVIYWFQKIIEK